MQDPLSPKQLDYITHATKKWNFAHGSVRTGKTVCTTFAFLHYAYHCPDSRLYIVGHTFDTAYRNIIRFILESEEMKIFRPFCSWSGKKLLFRDKTITVMGAKDEGALGAFQGLTISGVLCDELTLYPESIIMMIDSRLSLPHSRAFAAMNPAQPKHIIKQWIDKGEQGDKNYYSLHFTLADTPYVSQEYKDRIRDSSSGVFYKRNYLGLWCMAEGAIFDFFDRGLHVLPRPPCAAEYWIAGIDYGASNSFACVLIGISTGQYSQTGKVMWVEAEYYWDHHKQERQKTNFELADDVVQFLDGYNVKQLYIDPSAASFKTELRKRGIGVIDANNDVEEGIYQMTSEIKRGYLYVCAGCTNLIREIESYVWDKKAAEKGEDKPLKKDDHALDALRYAISSHKVTEYQPYKHNPSDYHANRFNPTPSNRIY
jgi:PBSX family phage terminase large subunit